MDQFFSFYADCIPVRGISRGIIYDLSRQKYRFIPKELFEILDVTDKHSVQYLNQLFPDVELFFDLFVEEHFAFYCNKDELELFPKINKDFFMPSLINNSIIDINNYDDQKNNIKKFIKEVDILGCEAIQLRSYTNIDQKYLNDLIMLINESNISYIELIIKYNEDVNDKKFCDFYINNPKLRSIIIHSSPENKFDYFNTDGQGDLIYITDELQNNNHCGVIDSSIFNINVKMFTESLSYNSCLNKKISLDFDGLIKICPSMKTHFGSIRDVRLIDIVQSDDFNKWGKITKDQIEICKFCEFRYMCTDCRAFIQNEQNVYSKPAKCKYDPYTLTWN